MAVPEMRCTAAAAQAKGSKDMTLGDRIFTARTERGFSLRELSRRSGVSNPLISQIESGHVANPGFFTVAKLARALDLNMNAFLPRRLDARATMTELMKAKP